MLPPKINHFVSSLIEKTNSGEINWSLNNDYDVIEMDVDSFYMKIQYSFNEIEEIGEFTIIYFDKKEGRDYRFYTNQTYTDYQIVRILYDAAQASNLKLPF